MALIRTHSNMPDMREKPPSTDTQPAGADMQPVRLSSAQVRRIYDRLAPTYDRLTTAFESRARARVLELVGRDGDRRILEVAVGTGAAFAQILGLNGDGLTVGLDLSPKMLSRSARRAHRSGNGSYLLLQAEARHLPFPDDRFDVVTNSYMLDLLPVEGIRDVLSEYMRVLKPGGRVVLVNMTQGRSWLSRAWEWLYKRSPSLLAGCRAVFAAPFLEELGFEGVQREVVSQLSFPSEILEATKPEARPAASAEA